MLDYKYLRELYEIFNHRGDAQIIISLSAHPSLRYSELARATSDHISQRLSDGEFNRCLRRLEDNDLLIGEGPQHHKIYHLTSRGRDKAALLSFILDALQQRDHEHPSD